MPVIHLYTPHADPVTARAAAKDLAAAVAHALGLQAVDVVAAVVPVSSVVTGAGASEDDWPTAIIHGRDRGPEDTAAALAAAVAALAASFGVGAERVWAQWCYA